MGMKDSEFITLIILLIVVLGYGGVVFWVAEKYGNAIGMIGLNLMHLIFILYAFLKLKREKKNE